MFPEICKIGPFTVYSYGLMLAIAFAVASTLAGIRAKKLGLNPNLVFNLAFISFISGIIGGRIFYIAYNFGYYYKRPLEMIMLQHGGLSWFGALILGSLCGLIYLKKIKAPIYKFLDLIAPFAALGQAIGRIGCLLNGCCYGKESQFGIYFPVHHAVLIPAQIYSSLFLILLFIILRFLQERSHKEGLIFYAYLLLYPAGRFFIEFWRADNLPVLLGLTLFQLLSIPIFFFALIKICRNIR